MANEKILVVDDDANICELLRLYLTKEGYQVTVANDGERKDWQKFNAVSRIWCMLDVMMAPAWTVLRSAAASARRATPR